MSEKAAAPLSAWSAAVRAATLVAVDPAGIGGMTVRARPGPARDRLMAYAGALCPAPMPVKRIPVNVGDGRLLGGLDLAATLSAGRPIAERGLLAEADGGIVILHSAERLDSGAVARITSALDQGKVTAARDGMAFDAAARFGVIAMDEGIADDERSPVALTDRLAFLFNLDTVRTTDAVAPERMADKVAAARRALADVTASDEIVIALTTAAYAMGIDSARAPLLALKVARAVAALDGRLTVSEADAALAAQLVLAPRATVLPPDVSEPENQQEQPPPPPEQKADNAEDDAEPNPDMPLSDMVLEAAKAAIPAGLLATLRIEQARRPRTRSSGRAGAKQKSLRHGRPLGVRRGELKRGARLSVIETLRAAAMWQPLRRREAAMRGLATDAGRRRVEVRKDDFRITRFKNQSETTTIFVVDASGSAALHRLAEAKGAVELLLADCYVRRDSVALIAFRGKMAELLLPPTRSLARAKRSLAGLPGGGGTPLAHGMDAALTLAEAVRRKGHTPTVIILTDGRANIARDGSPGRPKAEADSLAAARAMALAGITSLVIDTSPHAAQQSERLALAMGAVYLPLPHADAAVVSRAVKASQDAGRDSRLPSR
jgi:magnesium chelatase subunit D